MQLTRVHWLALASVASAATISALAACSSASIESFGGSFASSATAGESRGVGGTGTATAVEEPRCPTERPKGTDFCNSPGAVCTYGPDVREDCNDTYECRSGRWLASTPTCAADCPKSFDAIAQGAVCPDSDVACSYDEATCGCVGSEVPVDPPDDAGAGDAATDGGADGGEGGMTFTPRPGVWKCVPPPTTVPCPSARPRVLDPCVKEVSCDYGSCELGPRALVYTCGQGFWQGPRLAPGCDQ